METKLRYRKKFDKKKMNINLAKSEIIHFVGIGGIGMSGLALIMTGLGFKIQGSDKSFNKNIERLKKKI